MQSVIEQQNSPAFVDRRSPAVPREGGPERRQFLATPSSSPDVAELSEAVDQYKLRHHRRFITFEELFNVITGLGYHK